MITVILFFFFIKSFSCPSHPFHLSGKPNSPYGIEFVNATSNSITLSWKPGFDGGLPQSFRVRYKPVDARGYVYVDVRPFGATTFRIKGKDSV